KWRREHFALEAERADRGDERDRSIREERQLADAKVAAQRRLELFVLRPHVGQVLSRPHVFEPRHQRFERRQKRTRDVDRHVERDRRGRPDDQAFPSAKCRSRLSTPISTRSWYWPFL